jgi:CRISPR-associated endoribonuclease Cas6
MRLLMRLRAVENSAYERQYHYHLQGFIYNLLRGSIYDQIHNKEGYKFFCFSNVFPAKELHLNDIRTLIVSSPDSDFIKYLNEILQMFLDRGTEVRIGVMRFKIDSLHNLIVRLPDASPFGLVTGTPIIVRVRREKYKAYDSEAMKKYDYVYWRSDHPIDIFINQLENNLSKKYAQYHHTVNSIRSSETHDHKEAPEIPHLLSSFKFKKQISTRVFMRGFGQVVIGTLWEFVFNIDVNRNIIQFALDSGLGERNSLGFGFMNLL